MQGGSKGEPKAKQASLGEKNTFYYDDKVGLLCAS